MSRGKIGITRVLPSRVSNRVLQYIPSGSDPNFFAKSRNIDGLFGITDPVNLNPECHFHYTSKSFESLVFPKNVDRTVGGGGGRVGGGYLGEFLLGVCGLAS